MGMRMTGLISGMDTESMVKELVAASSSKVDKVKKEKQLLEWKQEAWQGLNTKLYDFYKTEVSSLRLASSFKSKRATSSDETKVSVKAGSAAANGTHSVSVKQLASSAYLTGANIKAAGKAYTAYAKSASSTKFEDMTDVNGNSLNLKGATISIASGNDAIANLTFTLGGEGADGVASIDELNKKLSETAGYEGLRAGIVDGKLTFTNISASDDTIADDIYTIESADLGISGEVGFTVDEAAGKTNTLSGTTDLRYEKNFTSADITKTTRLSEMGIAVGTTFSIGDKDFTVSEETTIADFTSGISKLGVSASFDEKQGRFYINSASSGSANDFDLTVKSPAGSDALDILGLSQSAGATKVDAQDAIITYNGVDYTGSSNTFELNGLTITARGVTGIYDKATNTLTNDSPISIEASTDTEGIYNTIKNFVKKYNELIDEMNTLYNEKKPEYEPLTEEERSQLSDTQIEKWEKKAKVGLLRRDDTLNSLLSSMRNILNQGVTVTDKDGNEKRVSLASLGIVTGDYTEKGKLHILGDEDDPLYAAQENKLKKALEEDSDIFSQVFVGDKKNPGLGTSLYSHLGKAMARKENSSRSQTFYNDITLEEEIKDKDDEIDKWAEKLQALEDKYYDQFAAMESAMAAMQSQQSYIASLMGTA